MSAYPALDFLRKVEVWQHAPGGTAGLAVMLPEGDDTTLGGLLARIRADGPSTGLESQARYWLIGYRETNPPLTEAQRTELDAVIDRDPQWWPPPPRGKIPDVRNKGGFWTARRVRAAVIGAVAGLVLGLTGAGIWHAVGGSGNGSPPAAGAPANPAAGPQAGPLTDLQRFRADWGIPAAASPEAGLPGQLVLLQDGLYYPSPWGIPSGDPGWVAGTSGTVAGTPAVHDGLADITDSDGTTWTVAVGQPFVLAPDPQVVLRVLRDAAVQSMPQPHAIAVRKHTATGR